MKPEELAEIRERFERLDSLNDAENPGGKKFYKALQHRAWACAWDVETLLDEVSLLTRQLAQSVRRECTALCKDIEQDRDRLRAALKYKTGLIRQTEMDDSFHFAACDTIPLKCPGCEIDGIKNDATISERRYQAQLKHRADDYRRTLHEVMECARQAVLAAEQERDRQSNEAATEAWSRIRSVLQLLDSGAVGEYELFEGGMKEMAGRIRTVLDRPYVVNDSPPCPRTSLEGRKCYLPVHTTAQACRWSHVGDTAPRGLKSVPPEMIRKPSLDRFASYVCPACQGTNENGGWQECKACKATSCPECGQPSGEGHTPSCSVPKLHPKNKVQ